MNNRQNSSDSSSERGAIGAWWGAWLNVGILLLTVRNLHINTQTLHISTENARHTAESANTNKQVLEILKDINSKL